MRWMRRLRSVLSLGAIGGGIGALFGVAFLAGLGIVDPTTLQMVEGLGIIATTGLIGSFMGVSFAGVLTLTSRRRSLDAISGGRSILIGALAGAIFAVPLLGIGMPPVDLPFFAAFFGVLGGGLGGGLVAVAKGAQPAELSAGEAGRR